MSLAVLLGGARSGKSRLALRRGLAHDGPVCFVATATAGDEEMAARIARHRAERPGTWETMEEPLELDAAIARAGEDALVIVDCLTLWVSNQLAGGASDEDVAEHALRAASRVAARRAPVIAVTNELGMGIVPADRLTRRFRDIHGRVNAAWVAHADEACLVVAGALLPLTRADPAEYANDPQHGQEPARHGEDPPRGEDRPQCEVPAGHSDGPGRGDGFAPPGTVR
jgi:adenosyl cobinamide kinase/adenosyl cobinamide phosphate guanylyltransferase